jgi:pimeloyl-ACP methyl ester carboxylesterase
MTPTQNKPGIVFCHGLWADGSCFSKLIVPLQAEGYECIAAQYGLNTTAEDVALVKATMGRISGLVILVGHSYGGSVITGAGTDDRVVGLVYICALAPDADETSQTQQSKFPKTDVFSHIEVVDGRIWLRPEGTKYFCGDLSEQEQKLVWGPRASPTRPVRGESRGNRLEVEAELVHRRQKRPHRASRSGARHGQAHGRNHL